MRDLSVSVIIPTYQRPEVLRQAVTSLFDGTTRQPDEVIIVGRKSDHETVAAITELQQHPTYGGYLKSAWVTRPGHIAPIETGLKAASGDIVAVIDDDVTVTPHWLSQLTSHFADATIGVVGGRVIVPGRPPVKMKGTPGRFNWFGYSGTNIASVDGTESFAVDSLQECNWAWRRHVFNQVEFDPIFHLGDATRYGVDLCQQAKAMNYTVLYDPRAPVYHHVAPRAADLDRSNLPWRRFVYARNLTYVMLKHLPHCRRGAFLIWWLLIGGRGGAGLGALTVELLSGRLYRYREFLYSLVGTVDGIRLWLRRQTHV
jgi:glycosyltransferase involved in cell wall biosynthesis